jgi:hypothetical protein
MMFEFIGEIIKVPIKIVKSGGAIIKSGLDASIGEDTDLCGDIDDIWQEED